MKTTMIRLVALLLLLASSANLTRACSCLGPITLESSLERNDAVVKVKILYQIYPDDKVPSDNPFETVVQYYYYEALVDVVYKGCHSNNIIIIKTGSSGGLCGVFLQPMDDVLLSGYLEYTQLDWYHYWAGGNIPVLDVFLCDFQSSVSLLTADHQLLLDEAPGPSGQCPSVTGGSVDCDVPGACPLPLPGEIFTCEDGSVGGKVGPCAYDAMASSCVVQSVDCTPALRQACAVSSECLGESQYCSTSNECLGMGTCETAADCAVADNAVEYKSVTTCAYYIACEFNSCTKKCYGT